MFDLMVPAFGLAVIGLVQGAGVSQSYPNPDGNYPDTSGDFIGQGVANLGGGLFGSIPVGGSLSGTALAVGAGATSHWTNMLTGIFVAIAVLLFANIVEQLPMAALAGLLVLNGYRAIKIDQILAVLRTNVRAGTIMLLTFAATLIIPLQFAILLGVVLSFLLYVIHSVDKFVLTELVVGASGLPNQGKLMLVGVSPVVQNQLVRTGTAELIGTENIFPATSRYGEAFLLAQSAATAWLKQQQNSPSS